MDEQRRKELLAAYKTRKPQMGVIFCRCDETGDTFLQAAHDTHAAVNSIRTKLCMGGYHPNRELMALLRQYGRDAFSFGVLETLDYDDETQDYESKLNALCQSCIARDEKAHLLWR